MRALIQKLKSDLTHRSLIYTKGLLFLLAGCLGAIVILIEQPHLRTFLALAVTIWCFCRCYYFAFYVMERYVDPAFRYSGLFSLLLHLCSTKTTSKRF